MIFETVAELLADMFDTDPAEITLNTDFLVDLNADSLDGMELAMALEEEFDLEDLTEEDFSEFKTVGDVVEYLRERLD